MIWRNVIIEPIMINELIINRCKEDYTLDKNYI